MQQLILYQTSNFVGKKINLPEKLKFVLGKVENSAGKGENAG